MDQIIEALGNIGFDWKVALANFVNFLIIFWILKRFAFKPMQDRIEERNKLIADGVDHAKRAEEQLKSAKEEYEAQITEAKKEAHSIIALAQEEKKNIIEKAGSEATEKAEEIVKRAEERMEAEMNQLKIEFKKYAAELSIQTAEKIVGETLDQKQAEEVVKKMTA